jgi:putative peptide zinc metalloprotease protein
MVDVLPKVRRNLGYVRQVQDGRVVYVVKDPIGLRYFRFGEVETWLMQRMDGSRTARQVAEELRESLGLAVAPAAVETFHRRLKELGLAERPASERSVLILEAVRRQRRARARVRGNTLLRMRFSLGDPDELFDRVVDRIRFFWTPGFVAFSLVAFAVYGLVLATHWQPFVAGMAAFYDPSQYSLGLVLTLYLSAIVIIVIHELGHGLTCKNFGGEVHEIGGMLLYFSPALFCNVNDAWTFEKKAHRLWVTFAGGWVQLLIAAFAAVVWIAVEPTSWVHRLAFIAVFVGGGLSVLINFNPLIPLDGYYALMDWLEIPNLRARSFEYLGAYLKRGILRMDVPLPSATDRERRVFLIYGSLAVVYTTLLLLAVGVWAGVLLVRTFGGWGATILLVGGWALLRGPIRRAARVLQVRAMEARSAGLGRGPVLAAAGVSALVLLGLLLPWTVRASGVAVVEPVQRAWLRPADPGLVESVLVAEGAVVEEGAALAVLRNPELDLEWTRARAAAEALAQEVGAARTNGQLAGLRQLEQQLEAQRDLLAVLERRRSELVLRAPFAARVASARPEEHLGARALPGEALLELWSLEPPRVRVLLSEPGAGEVRPGAALGIKFPVRAGWTWRTRVEQVGPAARDGGLELLAPLGMPGPDSPLRPGMVGRAKVEVERTTVAGALLRELRRTVRLDWLL